MLLFRNKWKMRGIFEILGKRNEVKIYKESKKKSWDLELAAASPCVWPICLESRRTLLLSISTATWGRRRTRASIYYNITWRISQGNKFHNLTSQRHRFFRWLLYSIDLAYLWFHGKKISALMTSLLNQCTTISGFRLFFASYFVSGFNAFLETSAQLWNYKTFDR